MKKFLTILIIFVLLLGIPISAGVNPPKSTSAKELGNFLGSIATFWLHVFETAWEKVASSISCRG